MKPRTSSSKGPPSSIENWTPAGGVAGVDDYHWTDTWKTAFGNHQIAFTITAHGGLDMIWEGHHWEWPKQFSRDDRLRLGTKVAQKTLLALLKKGDAKRIGWKKGQKVNDWYLADMMRLAEDTSLHDQVVKLAFDNPGEIRDKLLPILRVAGQFDKELTVFKRQWPFYSELGMVFEKMNTGREVYVGRGSDQIPPRRAAQMERAGLVDRISGPGGDFLELTAKGIRQYQNADNEFSKI